MYFPYEGEIVETTNGESKSYSSKTTDSSNHNFSVIVTEELTYAPTVSLTGNGYKFINIHYPDVSRGGATYGVLSTNNQNEYQQYLYTNFTINELIKNFTPTILDYKVGTYKRFQWTWPNNYTENVSYSSLPTAAKTALGLVSLGSMSFYGTSYNDHYQANSNNGYQVRCVIDSISN